MKKNERSGAVRNRRSRAGETLTETLITMLIVGLSSVLFITMVGASGRIFRSSKTKYDEIYGKIAAADVQSGTPFEGAITVTGSSSTAVSVKVNWYGDTSYVLSYKVK